jgi:hypothetical protein
MAGLVVVRSTKKGGGLKEAASGKRTKKYTRFKRNTFTIAGGKNMNLISSTRAHLSPLLTSK